MSTEDVYTSDEGSLLPENEESSAFTRRETPSPARRTEAAPVEYEAAPSDISQVRDLLFGSHNREYERRFRLLERQNEVLNSNLQRLTERLNRMDAENAELRERIRDQHMQLQPRLDEMQLALHNRMEEIQRFLAERLRAQQQDMDRQFEELHSIVNNTFDELDDSKLDQNQMADMVMELAMRIKRNNQRPDEQSSQRLLEE